MSSAALRSRAVVPVLAVIASIPLLWAASSDAPSTMDRQLFDFAAAKLLEPAPTNDAIIFVDIDDESLQELGERWPISRLTWARLVRALSAAQPNAIALDAFFPEPNIRGEVKLALDVADQIRDASLDTVPDGKKIADYLDKQAALRDADRQLAGALADAGNVVLGVVDEGRAHLNATPPLLLPVPGAVTPTSDFAHLIAPKGSIPRFSDVAIAQASLYVPYDTDGVVRRYHYLYRYQQTAVASLALAAVQVAFPKRAKAFGEAVMTLDGATALLRYPDPSRIKRVKVVDVLSTNPEKLRAIFRGKIVFVGVSAIGAADHRATPVDSQLPGSMIHVTAAAALLNRSLVPTRGLQHTLTCLVALLLAFSVIIAAGRISQTGVVALVGFLVLLIWSSVAFVLAEQGVFLPVVPTWIAVIVPLTGNLITRSMLAEADRKRIRRAFSHYLDPSVVEELVEHPDRLKLGGERLEITALFSDVVGFTSISEVLDPGELVLLLNEYLSAMTTIIIEEGGIIDKYVGDAIVAMFGAPVHQPDHAVRACRAAVRCNVKLASMRDGWLARGLPPIEARIGVNSGVAVVGNMGSAERFDYTMMGDMVNLAARLESANKRFATDLMTSASTAALLDDSIVLRELDTIAVKGKSESVVVFEIVGLDGDVDGVLRAMHAEFEKGLYAWRQRAWSEARAHFAVAADAGDETAEMFLTRLAQIQKDPPSAAWDGVFRQRSK